MAETTALELISAMASAVLIVMAGLTILAYLQQVQIGAERREKSFTLIISTGIILLALSEITNTAKFSELASQTLKLSSLILFAIALYFHFKRYAGRYVGQHPPQAQASQSAKPAARTKHTHMH